MLANFESHLNAVRVCVGGPGVGKGRLLPIAQVKVALTQCLVFSKLC